MKNADPAIVSMTSKLAKLYYGLDEAEAMLGMSSGTLIHMGARRGLPLYVIPQDWQVTYRSRTIANGEHIEPPKEGSWPKAQPALTDRLTIPVRLYQETLARYEFDSTATTRNFFIDNKFQSFFQPETGQHIHSWEGVSNDSTLTQKQMVTDGTTPTPSPMGAAALAASGVAADPDKTQWTYGEEVASQQIYEFEIPQRFLLAGSTGIAIASCVIVVMAEDLPKIPVEAAPLPTTAISVTEKKAPISKAPNSFVSSLIQLLVEISRRAASAVPPVPFNTLEMPGVKADLKELAEEFDVELKHPLSTFDTYIAGLIKFKSGAQPTEFYRQLFPDQFK